MNTSINLHITDSNPLIPGLLGLSGDCLAMLDMLMAGIASSLRNNVIVNHRIVPDRLVHYQYSLHVFAWLATYVEALHQFRKWAGELASAGKLLEIDELLLQIGFGEYIQQVCGGIIMSQGEIGRLSDLGIEQSELDHLLANPVIRLMRTGNSDAARRLLSQMLIEGEGNIAFGNTGLDEEMELVRENFFRFSNERVRPFANSWHHNNDLIPMDLIEELARLGVFGLTVPEDYNGMGISKIGMCVVSEELSRGYLGVGSLATRCEIAAELISNGGVQRQKNDWLPKIASGEIRPTAVFTEPGSGSDLASLKTRAMRHGDVYHVTGNKTWITHASRANMMILLARTNPDSIDHRGLSMFIAPKQSGTIVDPFPDHGISGSEIEVLGYRGMREYELAFDRFEIGSDNLLGEREGHGFRQLMATFESARIQTAARSIGVAQSALDAGLKYATERKQFGQKIVEYSRIYSKLSVMAAEIMIVRQLSYHAARQKDKDHRCDLEAGMAKLLAARVAWAASDNAVQIHGGNGFALEYDVSRILCDARILSIFEGAAEIQATVIARRLLEQSVN